MKLEIKNKKENPLLHRTEIKALLTWEGATPSNEKVKKEIASQLKADEKLVIVKHIYTKFGTTTADVLAYLYEDQESMKTIEFLKPSAEKKEEKPAEEKAEKPAEKKEETKEETKSE